MSRRSRKGAREAVGVLWEVLWGLGAPRLREPGLADLIFVPHTFVSAVRSPVGPTRWRRRGRTVSVHGRPGYSRPGPSRVTAACFHLPVWHRVPTSRHVYPCPAPSSLGPACCQLQVFPGGSLFLPCHCLPAVPLQGGSCNLPSPVSLLAPGWLHGLAPTFLRGIPHPCHSESPQGHPSALPGQPSALGLPFSAFAVGVIPKALPSQLGSSCPWS